MSASGPSGLLVYLSHRLVRMRWNYLTWVKTIEILICCARKNCHLAPLILTIDRYQQVADEGPGRFLFLSFILIKAYDFDKPVNHSYIIKLVTLFNYH